MGYAGKWRERERARELRAQSWTLARIAAEVGAAKGTVSVWVRDVDHVPNPRNRGHPSGPKHPMRVKKEAELAACAIEASEWVGSLSDRDLAMFALALYAGEGAKRDGSIVFANSDPRLISAFLQYLRTSFEVADDKLRLRLYLHADLDLDAAVEFWSNLTGIPSHQFTKPYRAVPDATMRHNRHVNGCVGIVLHNRALHRRVMARIEAVLCALTNPG
jgi:hypothetical protein